MNRPRHFVSTSNNLTSLLCNLMLTTFIVNSLVSCNQEEPSVKIESVKTEQLMSDTEILKAVSNGDIDSINQFLHSEHCDINKEYDAEFYTKHFGYSTQFTLLYYAVATNQPNIVKLLLNTPNIDVNKGDNFGRTPLYTAANKENTECIELLLKAPDIDVNKAKNNGETPLHTAAVQGNKECIELLLKAPDIDVNKADDDGSTPLHDAINYGHAECVLLLSKAPGINVNKAKNNGETPLHTAAVQGKKECIELLLKAPDIDVNKADEHGRTPLHDAINCGHAEYVLLLSKAPGINANKANTKGETPLDCAFENGNTEILQSLLAISDLDTSAYPALHIAVIGNDIEQATKLLSETTTDINQADKSGKTALHYATSMENEECVKLLLSANSIAINKADKQGCTAYDIAEHKKNNNIKTLLSHQGGKRSAELINILQEILKKGNVKEIQQFINGSDVALNMEGTNYNPLQWVIESGNIDAIKLILNTPGIDVNKQHNGYTPLEYAARLAPPEILKLLLTAPGININKGAPFHEAAKHGRAENAKILLEVPGIQTSDFTEFDLAVICNDLNKLQELFNTRDEKTDKATLGAPLHWAIYGDYPEIVEFLLTIPDIDVNDKANTNIEPLRLAAQKSNTIFKLLLSAPEIDVNVTDEDGFSILWQAADEGDVEIVELLLASPNIDVNQGIITKDSSVPIPTLNNSYIKSYHEIGQMFRAAGAKSDDELAALPDVWLKMLEDDYEHNFEKAKNFCIANGVDFRYCERRPFKEDIKDIKINKMLVALPTIDINKRYGVHTALTLACWRGDKKIVQFLLAIPGIDVNKKSQFEESPLFIAAAQGYTDIVELLLSVPGIDININPNHSLSYPYNPSNKCSKPSDSKEVMKLLKDARYNRYYSHISLFEAIRKGDITEVRRRISSKNINRRSQIGETPLTLAIEIGQTEIVKFLLNSGNIDINKANILGLTPLSMAVKTGNIEIVKLLLEKSIDFETPYKDNWTPYELALIYKRTEIAKLLEKAYKIDVSPEMPLIYAVMTNNISLTKFLLKQPSCDVNETDAYGNTALTCAAIRGYTEIVQLLLDDSQINVNAVNGYGYTALNCAALRGHTEIVKLLLAKPRIDVNKAEPEYGNTPLDNAAENNHADIEELLKKAGAKHKESDDNFFLVISAIPRKTLIFHNITSNENKTTHYSNLGNILFLGFL